MTDDERMQRIDDLLTHVWMVRTFLKHSEEIEDDEELAEIMRKLYDYTHSLGAAWSAQDSEAYLQQARKKFHRLRKATEQFAEIQPDVSMHMNYQMARRSLETALRDIAAVLEVDEQA